MKNPFKRKSDDPLVHEGEVRTVLDCHDCSKDFIALLDYSVIGNHVIECPHCGHSHCRVIENGKVTGDRWDSRYGNDKTRDATKPRRVWKSNVLAAETSSASEFIRGRWMDKLYQ